MGFKPDWCAVKCAGSRCCAGFSILSLISPKQLQSYKDLHQHIDRSSQNYLGNTELKHGAKRFHVATPFSVRVSQSCPKQSKLLCETKTLQNLSPYQLSS